MNSVFVKILTVINSCETMPQLDNAVVYVGLAGKGKHINSTEWDLLFHRCSEKLKEIVFIKYQLVKKKLNDES